MERASVPRYDLFKLAVAVVLIAILLVMYLGGGATGSLAALPPTRTSPAIESAATDTPPAVSTETEQVTPAPEAATSTPPPDATSTATSGVAASSPTPTAPELSAVAAATATAPASQSTVCNTSVPSRLRVGQTAGAVQRLNMRTQPWITAPILQTNPANTQVEIIGGPVCTPVGAGGYLWWQIRLPTGAEGWSAEAPLNEATYLLEPAP